MVMELQLTSQELFDVKVALLDYRLKWFYLYEDGLMGKQPQNFSVEGARLVYESVCKLQERVSVLDDACYE